MKLFKWILILSYVYCNPGYAESSLNIATWGGDYEKAQQQALFKPFEQATGITIHTQPYQGGLEILNQKPLPDIIDMMDDEARIACRNGFLHKLSLAYISHPITHKAAPKSDFIKGALSPCGIAHLTYSMLIAFDNRAFKGEKPQTIADFFDIKRFPGKRGLHKEPNAVLEWALMAEGIPLRQVYDLLSTERGMGLAFKRLDTIRDHIVWWEGAEEPAQLLNTRQVVMSSGYNGRFFKAQEKGVTLSMLWDGHIIDSDVWVLPKKTKTDTVSTNAKRFLAFVMQPGRLAALAEHIPYGPTRFSALNRVGLNPKTGVDMSKHLPTAKHHLERALLRDPSWYAYTHTLRQRKFKEWLQKD